MADACVEMVGEVDSPEKRREARRRRMEMRRLLASTVADGEGPVKRHAAFGPTKGSPSEKRLRASSGDDDDDVGALSRPSRTQAFASSSSTSVSSSSSGEGPAEALMEEKAVAEDSSVLFGSISLAGRSREMEDAVSLRPVFFRPEGGPPLHFFAVFDGHGGSHVATLCKSRMHVLLAEELGRLPPGTPSTAEEESMKTALHRCFSRMDELALSSCACGKVGMPLCTCDRSGIESEIVGTTAALAIVSLDRVVVANCGDSRAVLSRGGRAVPLSSDHKPDRPDEQARIEAAGGRVIYLNGARVHGILAMSRALGDKYLKPVVISEPEICSVERTPQDEFLIIASDGLWDVLPNELACSVARRCLLETAEQAAEDAGSSSTENIDEAGRGEEQASDARCSLAATLLARLALGRRSADNISVIVINLRRLTS